MKSFVANLHHVNKNWYYIDAKDKILGRLSSKIAHYLKGKHKVEYTPHLDIGDYIVVINASKVLVTGNKRLNKFYYRYSGYIGGIKKVAFCDMLLKKSDEIIKLAVKGMLPKGSLGRSMLRKLKIYPLQDHFHKAQNPQYLNI
ncbi:50S ribosomal protein L13 [Buchnera aphidicola (Pterocallis alni)]|uniref:50S ribosomal protein L13 n=1 Tax=Buchnera aphidicola TaxID=9 RepID=UPI003463E96B